MTGLTWPKKRRQNRPFIFCFFARFSLWSTHIYEYRFFFLSGCIVPKLAALFFSKFYQFFWESSPKLRNLGRRKKKKRGAPRSFGPVVRTNPFEVIFSGDDGWWMTDDGWWMMGDGWWMMNDGWWVMDDGWWVMDDGWWMMGDGWWMMDDGWWMMGDGWWMMGDGWWVDDGWWVMEGDIGAPRVRSSENS